MIERTNRKLRDQNTRIAMGRRAVLIHWLTSLLLSVSRCFMKIAPMSRIVRHITSRVRELERVSSLGVCSKQQTFMNMDRNGGGEMEERRSIRDSSRKLKKYGSTAKHMTRNEHLIKHIVSKTDTLQGIALKYGVTTEQIRRINRLWASDSLFLREHLLVPVSADATASLAANAAFSPVDAPTSPDLPSAYSSSSIASPADDEGPSITDFLAKMDSSIANVKSEVKRVQGSSEFCYDGDSTHVQRRKATARLRNSHPVTSNPALEPSSVELLRPLSSNDVHSLPSAVVMTQGRRIKTSLQKLQQQQDEIFQL